MDADTDLDIDQAYSAWHTEPSQANLSRVVKKLRPTIDYSLAQYNSAGDPLMRAKAMSYTADTVVKFDPGQGASLPTFLASRLRQLSRVARQSRSPVRIPDRIHVEAMQLNHARRRFFDEHDREPDTLELADFAGVPVKRIATIRRNQVPIPAEGAMGEIEHQGPAYEEEALDYVFHDADHTDRRILEMKMGYAGHPVLSPRETALALNLSPTQLSRRSARLALRINRIRSTLES